TGGMLLSGTTDPAAPVPAVVQSAIIAGGCPDHQQLSVSLPLPISGTGHILVTGYGWGWASTQQATTISDAAADSFTTAAAVSGAGGDTGAALRIDYPGPLAAGGNAPTVTAAGSNLECDQLFVAELSGVLPQVDAAPTNASNTTVSLTNSQTDLVLVME